MIMTNSAAVSFYKTSDLTLAGVICVSGFALDHVEQLTSARSVFVFRESPELTALVDAYWRNDTRVEPQAYWAQIKALKARLYHG